MEGLVRKSRQPVAEAGVGQDYRRVVALGAMLAVMEYCSDGTRSPAVTQRSSFRTMSIHQRQLDLPNDLATALHLADISGLNIPHVADWPYRFSSWAVDNPLNTRAWFDSSSQLLGWVVMQTPFWAIDCIVHPDAPSSLYREMLEWAQMRAMEMAATGEGRPMWFISIPSGCLNQRHDLTALGFEDLSVAGNDAWSKVLFELVDDSLLASIELPSGYHIRNLDPSTEISAYVDLHRRVFQSENMTLGWRTKQPR